MINWLNFLVLHIWSKTFNQFFWPTSLEHNLLKLNKNQNVYAIVSNVKWEFKNPQSRGKGANISKHKTFWIDLQNSNAASPSINNDMAISEILNAAFSITYTCN